MEQQCRYTAQIKPKTTRLSFYIYGSQRYLNESLTLKLQNITNNTRNTLH